ncbi:MAG: putative oxidoreductase YcjS [Planctomycetes bacterium ADurb.Bin126]|nr:MAG: putative oxidoreductase YcjS [Planctomycetes bacterium ADurb.Bin126]HOD81330.1 Gfo/Idh/MocA family oxidoreductase [Phycisphaerae bacterium]HQL74580.1 Gfo/Idh/MocA family oxidoreductase [Phycisphaerae bacterium]
MKSTLSRRRLLGRAGAAIAAPYFLTSAALGDDKRPAASERIVMGTIGTGGQGTGDMRGFMGHGEVQMVAVCDVVPTHRERAREHVNGKYGNQDCFATGDFREVLARADIDAVLIGTPDHWHAIVTIEACKRGKDVYCEKPETLTIREGRAMVQAVRRYGRVFSGGSQRVLGDYGDWPRLVRGGALGTIKEAYVNCGGPSGPCNLPEETMPEGLDWNMWLGPAPWRPFHSTLIRGGFRPYRDYSGGGMTDWGAHRFGAAMFHTGVHLTGPTDIIPPDGKDVKHLTYVFPNGMKMYHGGTNNITYIGTEGELPSKRKLEVAGPTRYQGYRGRGGIFGDFLACVKSRQNAFRDIEIAHRACTVCHLGNIAYWLKRPLKWDPVKEQIIGDDEAARWLDRAKREPWTV